MMGRGVRLADLKIKSDIIFLQLQSIIYKKVVQT